jgi:hypothetical protein
MPGQRSERTGGGRRGRDPFARPLDRALQRLRAHGLPYKADGTRVDVWRAVCPFCRVPDWTLSLREHGYGGPLALQCAAGCTEPEINRALDQEPAEARIEAAEARAAEALELAEQARDLATRAVALATRLCGSRSSRARVGRAA